MLGGESVVLAAFVQAEVGSRGFSQAFYREKLYESDFGYPDLESFMKGFWEGWALKKGQDSICQIQGGLR